MIKILLNFTLIFIGMYLVDYLILKKYHSNEMEYLKLRFNLKRKYKETKKTKIFTSLINALIMSIVITFVIFIKVILLFKLIISFVLLIVLIYGFYGLYGMYLGRKNEKAKRK